MASLFASPPCCTYLAPLASDACKWSAHRELNKTVMPCRMKKDIVTGAANAVFVFNQVLAHLHVSIMISAFLTLKHLGSAHAPFPLEWKVGDTNVIK